jgi:hypothetical protein
VKKPRKPRAGRARAGGQPPDPPTSRAKPPAKERRGGFQHFLEHTNLLLGIAASAVVLIGAIYALCPTLDISADPVTNKTNAFDAEFNVTNKGQLPVYNLTIGCEINSRNGRGVVTEGNESQSPLGTLAGQGIDQLSPNSSVIRNCGAGFPGNFNSNLDYPASIKVTSEYTWPVVHIRRSVSRTFSSRQDSTGSITMVPDSGW